MKKYTPPPDPVYRAGKKKENATKALNLTKGLLANSPDDVDLKAAYSCLANYRKKLDII